MLYELSKQDVDNLLQIIDKSTVQGIQGASIVLHLVQVLQEPVAPNLSTPF